MRVSGATQHITLLKGDGFSEQCERLTLTRGKLQPPAALYLSTLHDNHSILRLDSFVLWRFEMSLLTVFFLEQEQERSAYLSGTFISFDLENNVLRVDLKTSATKHVFFPQTKMHMAETPLSRNFRTIFP